MSSSALLNRVALVLRSLAAGQPADEALREVMQAHRGWSPDEKRTLSGAVFAYHRWYRWLDLESSFQIQAEAALVLQERFDQDPRSIKVQALAARAVPGWLATEMELDPDWLRHLQRPPVLWLRPRAGKLKEVQENLGDCEAVWVERNATGYGFVEPRRGEHRPSGETGPWPDDCHLAALRYSGVRDLFRTESFQQGFFEIQDLASQVVGRFCAPRSGETWWDACAGEGGKTLHLADQMGGKGLIWASDRSLKRLEVLRKRAARAESFNYRQAVWEGTEKLPTKTLFDGVLVDAPCSGVGTWGRNPEARWTTTPKDVAELALVQKSLLLNASQAVKAGGRLVYAVCTLTRSETQGVVEAFEAQRPEFRRVYAGLVQAQSLASNGMYLAAWVR